MKYALILTIALSALAAGCGDNVESPQDLRDREVLIIPHEGESLAALESAVEAGFVDPIFMADADIISAFGTMDMADDAVTMPGIDYIVPAEEAPNPIRPNPPIEPNAPQSRFDGLTVEVGPNANK